jgi:hypothetical protein
MGEKPFDLSFKQGNAPRTKDFLFFLRLKLSETRNGRECPDTSCLSLGLVSTEISSGLLRHLAWAHLTLARRPRNPTQKPSSSDRKGLRQATLGSDQRLHRYNYPGRTGVIVLLHTVSARTVSLSIHNVTSSRHFIPSSNLHPQLLSSLNNGPSTLHTSFHPICQ